MAKICPKCGATGIGRKVCPRCGAKLKDITYRKLLGKNFSWPLLPIISVLIFVFAISVIVFKPPFFYSFEGNVLMTILVPIFLVFGFYTRRRMRARVAKLEHFERLYFERLLWKFSMMGSYIFGTILVIMGIWTYIFLSHLLGASDFMLSSIILISTIMVIIIGAFLLVRAEHLRRKLKKRRFN